MDKNKLDQEAKLIIEKEFKNKNLNINFGQIYPTYEIENENIYQDK